MTPLDAMLELMARMGASNGAAVLVSGEELSHWPAAAVKTMKSQALLVKARPAASVVCPGCEQECIMPVHTLPAGPRSPASFIVCDKRSDINRVAVPISRVEQWQASGTSIARLLAGLLGLRRPRAGDTPIGHWEIGMFKGVKRSQMLCLKANGELALVAGNNAVSLSELIYYRNGKYLLDQAMILQLVDSATTVDNRYTPTNARREVRKLDTLAMYESWQAEYRRLEKRRPNMSDVWYSQQIAKMAIAKGRNAGTIRKNMKS
jgi:hypothetical protein